MVAMATSLRHSISAMSSLYLFNLFKFVSSDSE